MRRNRNGLVRDTGSTRQEGLPCGSVLVVAIIKHHDQKQLKEDRKSFCLQLRSYSIAEDSRAGADAELGPST